MRETVGIPNVRERDLIISEDFPASVESMSKSGEAEASLMADNFPQTEIWSLKFVPVIWTIGCVNPARASDHTTYKSVVVKISSNLAQR